MSTVTSNMSVSLDGCFITGPDDSPEHMLGVGGDVLHDWIAADTADRTGSGPRHSAGEGTGPVIGATPG